MTRLLETISLFLLVTVITIRPLVAESYDSSTSSITEALGDISDPSPVRTLTFDLLILVSACFWLAARAADPSAAYRRTGLERTMPLWFIAAMISCIYAGNQRLAVNAALDWLCLLLAPILLAQLLTRPHHRLVLFAALIASAAAQTYECLDQYFLSHYETLAHYEAHKAEFWARQNVPLDSEKVILFENRIRAREALGHLPHSNVTASYLMLCLVPVAGWTIAASFGRRHNMNPTAAHRVTTSDASTDLDNSSLKKSGTGFEPVVCPVKNRSHNSLDGVHQQPDAKTALQVTIVGATLSALLILAVFLTGSRGALMSAVVGLCLYTGIRYARSRLATAARRRAYAALTVTCVFAFTALGLITYFGTHYTATLLFRWQYWRASLPMIADHFFTGIGRENFGRHYLAYKAINSPEEVATPHNPLIQIAADFGIVGVIAALVTIIGVVRALSRRSSHHLANGPLSTSVLVALRPFLAWGTGLATSLVAAKILLTDSSNSSFVYYTTVTTVLAWLFGFAAIVFMAVKWLGAGDHFNLVAGGRSEASQSVTTARVQPPPPSANQALDRLIHLSLVIFLIHELINFALFVPGSAITFFALLAIPLSTEVANSTTDARSQNEKHTFNRNLSWRSCAILACVTLIVIAGFVVLPVVRCYWHLQQTDRVATQPQPFGVRAGLISHHLTFAGIVDPLDPTPSERLAEWKLAESTVSDIPMESLFAAELAARESIRRDPHHLRPRRLLIRILRRQAELSGDAHDIQRVIAAAADAVALYPTDPNGYITLADAQAAAFGLTRSFSLARDAIAGYERALAMDEQRWSGETIRRFNERQKSELRTKIVELMSVLKDPASTNDD